MRYNLSYKESKINAFKKLFEYSEKGLIIDISLIKKTRSNLQNRALHLYFTMLADEFLNIGYDFNYTNPFTNEIISIPYTCDLVKEYIWRPLQNQMFKIESTTKLTTEMINLILEVISNWLAEKEICVNFPNKFDLLIKQLNEHEKQL